MQAQRGLWTFRAAKRKFTAMVRQFPNSSQRTAARPASATLARQKSPALCDVRCENDHGRTSVVFVRKFRAPRREVWALLTSPERLRMWAPHASDHELSQVGRVTFTLLGDDVDGHADVPDFELPGVVLTVDAPDLLEHSWGRDVLLWSLEDVTDSTRLTLRHTLADASMASAVAAGWHLCFEVADSVLADRPIAPMRGPGAMRYGWEPLNRRCAKTLGVQPTRLG